MPEPQSPGSRRGLFSCLHSRCDDASNPGFQGTAITEALPGLIDRLYAEAFDRLPFDDLGTERLLNTMRSGGGICVGLLDPVSNIILNTISVLPPRDSRRYNLRKTPERKRLAGAVQPDYIWPPATSTGHAPILRSPSCSWSTIYMLLLSLNFPTPHPKGRRPPSSVRQPLHGTMRLTSWCGSTRCPCLRISSSPPPRFSARVAGTSPSTMSTPSFSLKSCGDACEYTESLKMRLHGMIHAFYLKVFTMLPSDVLRGLMRYILFDGHCYGPMDPVSNIIINSIWHSMFFPLPSAGSESQAYDILDTLSMLRVEVRSLNGLIALVKANSDCSMQQAMEYLCSNSCHMSQDISTPHGFHTAAEAAQHPQHAALGSFLSSLTPHMLANLRPFLGINNGTHSSETLHQVRFVLARELRQTAVLLPPKEAQLCKVVKDALLIKRSECKNMRLFIRSELAEVLKKYASEHPQEPKYEPSVICGLVESYYSDRDSYHVNFVAASESGDDNQLFFAELNLTCDQSKPSFCIRLCLTDMDSLHLVDNVGDLMLVYHRGVDLDAGTIHQVKSLGVGGRALFVSTYFSLSVSIKVFPSGIRGNIIYPSFDFWERKQTEGYHLANGSIIKSYALEHHQVAQPHTLVDCLSLCSTRKIEKTGI
ncbi:hypothetical protein ACQ4PT_047124 [Festuca glaucescens]